jgi:GTP-binding protein EngB required for normal cell division
MTKSAENIEKKIEAQLEKLKQLKAQKQAIEAREKTKQKEQDRKDDTRRKILLGSMYIQKMRNDENFSAQVLTQLDKYLTENRDRQLFDLSDIEA